MEGSEGWLGEEREGERLMVSEGRGKVRGRWWEGGGR